MMTTICIGTDTNLYTSGTAWVNWCDTTGTTSTTGTAITFDVGWSSWCNTTALYFPIDTGAMVAMPAAEFTPEQREAIEARETAAREVHARLQREAAEATARAEALLIENLSLRQQVEYKQHKHFDVHGNSGRRYRIRHGRTHNIDVVNREGKLTHRLCAHIRIDAPNADNMLAQKLHLEHDDAAFLRMGNLSTQPGDVQLMERLH